jgi:polyisoprenoid-binding protein YceI
MTMTIPAGAVTGTYILDTAHSQIGFLVRHAMITKVRGSFDQFEGSGFFDTEDPGRSNVRLTIRADSISTHDSDRDAHLRSNDFFDTERFPEIIFASTGFEMTDDTTYQVTGDLTIKDITRPVTIELEYTGAVVDPYQNHRIGFEGRATVNRKDWGISWNAVLQAGGILVGEKVALELEVSAIKRS